MDSSYLALSGREEFSLETAKLIIYVCESLGKNPPKKVVSVTKKTYGDHSRNKYLFKKLKKIIKGLSKEDKERIMFNGRSAKSRKLADWWDKRKSAKFLYL